MNFNEFSYVLTYLGIFQALEDLSFLSAAFGGMVSSTQEVAKLEATVAQNQAWAKHHHMH